MGSFKADVAADAIDLGSLPAQVNRKDISLSVLSGLWRFRIDYLISDFSISSLLD
jgi:hypothetical protein